MQTIKRGIEPTGWMLVPPHKTCKANGAKPVRIETGVKFRDGWSGSAETGWTRADFSLTVPCNGCGKPINVEQWGQMVYGKFVTEKVCDGRCMGATGRNCECQCGGLNHGGAHNIK